MKIHLVFTVLKGGSGCDNANDDDAAEWNANVGNAVDVPVSADFASWRVRHTKHGDHDVYIECAGQL